MTLVAFEHYNCSCLLTYLPYCLSMCLYCVMTHMTDTDTSNKCCSGNQTLPHCRNSRRTTLREKLWMNTACWLWTYRYILPCITSSHSGHRPTVHSALPSVTTMSCNKDTAVHSNIWSSPAGCSMATITHECPLRAQYRPEQHCILHDFQAFCYKQSMMLIFQV